MLFAIRGRVSKLTIPAVFWWGVFFCLLQFHRHGDVPDPFVTMCLILQHYCVVSCIEEQNIVVASCCLLSYVVAACCRSRPIKLLQMIIRINNSCSLDHTLIKSYVWHSHKIRWFAAVLRVDFFLFHPVNVSFYTLADYFWLTHPFHHLCNQPHADRVWFQTRARKRLFSRRWNNMKRNLELCEEVHEKQN